jgi:UDP-N-acetylmuramoyl-tripeptide--D-alanyl-D-alanine ligase
MEFTVAEVLAATDGRLLSGTTEAPAGNVSTDTRALEAGQTFVALRGERFDAHDFLPDAVRRGAACLVVDREEKLPALGGAATRTAAVLVRDTQAALADLGRAARGRLRCPVIAITGSCGKTTVKDMLGQVLGPRLKGKTPPASYNNQVGVPLTLLAAEEDDQFVLCEFGTNHPGEIAHLAGIARPTLGVVTLVAPVHLEGLSSIQGVAREKGALVESLGEDGVAILNADDRRVASMARKCRGRVVTVGKNRGADLRLENLVQAEDGLRFTAQYGPVSAGRRGDQAVAFEIPVLGEHQAVLALLAAAAAREVGVPLEASAEALRRFRPPRMRLALERAGDVTILNDAYNANPRSVRAALGLLALWPGRRKVFFCGDMRELAQASRPEHEKIGRAVRRAGVAQLVCVGPESKAAARAAVAAGMKRAAVATFADAQEAARAAAGFVESGDLVLIKGSRAIRMEQIAEAIAEARRPQAAGCRAPVNSGGRG